MVNENSELLLVFESLNEEVDVLGVQLRGGFDAHRDVLRGDVENLHQASGGGVVVADHAVELFGVVVVVDCEQNQVAKVVVLVCSGLSHRVSVG